MAGGERSDRPGLRRWTRRRKGEEEEEEEDAAAAGGPFITLKASIH